MNTVVDDQQLPCPCCGHLVFDELPGSYSICPICYWEDDHVQLRFPTLSGGANKPSLLEAQRNFSHFGACEERFKPDVRKPTPQDVRDLGWRPVDGVSDNFEKTFPIGDDLMPYPDDLETLYYWRSDYWRRKVA